MRRRQSEKRETKPDHRYGDVYVTRFINSILAEGKKTVAERIVYDAIDIANGKGEAPANPVEIVHKAIDCAKPRVEVRARRVGGATYQVPSEVAPERGLALAVRWIIISARKRRGIGMARALAAELKEAAAGQGGAVKRREDVHKMAQANKAFAHFRW